MGVGLPTSRDIYLSWILFCVRRAYGWYHKDIVLPQGQRGSTTT